MVREEEVGCKVRYGEDIHNVVHLVDCQAGVYLLHSGTGVLHCIQCLLVDVRCLDRIYLALECHYLC